MKIEVLPGLWIASEYYSDNALFLRDKNIGFLVNCQKDLEFLGKSDGYNDQIRMNIEKYEVLKFNKYLFEITERIYDKIKDNINVMVFCKDTTQKSPTIVLCYIMRYGMLNKDNSLELLKSKCPDIFSPYMTYQKTIDKFVDELFNK
jgi:protein-tyrosine phosphatase